MLSDAYMLPTLGRWATSFGEWAVGQAAQAAVAQVAAVPQLSRPPLSPLSLMQSGGVARLLPLPARFTDLFPVRATCRRTGCSPDEPALCMLCGRLLCAGSACCKVNGVGALTQHAAVCGRGTGLFFLLYKCSTVLIRGLHAAYAFSVYVDEHGEEDSGLRRGLPLMVDSKRVAQLEHLWASHGVAREVVLERTVRDRVIRDNYW
uniref:E3 ubiquitin-protein ligase n=1 Tax=Calcidiscus leptoporus TaxID=127549 RepID=A0A7S0IVX6_9EUKA